MTVTYIDREYLYKEERRVENGYEIVSLSFSADQLYLLESVSKDGKDIYKKILTTWCGYPRHEWTRIKEVVPLKQDDGGYVIEVWFRNPGKQFEKFLETQMLDEPCLIEVGHGTGAYKLGQTIYPVLELDKDALSWVQRG